MRFRSMALAALATVALTACQTTPTVHNFDKPAKIGDVTVTQKQQCHASNDAIGAGAGGIILGPIGFVGGLLAGEYLSHKNCK